MRITSVLLWILECWPFQISWCHSHGAWRRSTSALGSLCRQCMRARFVLEEATDRRPAWTKSEGVWPIKPAAKPAPRHAKPIKFLAPTPTEQIEQIEHLMRLIK